MSSSAISTDVNRRAAQRSPEEAHPILVWKVMGRLDQYDRRQRLAKRWLAGASLAAATLIARRRVNRS
ncbi:MAG: hypothetical protein F4138_06845 [Acidimicrobiia bacterium]|nr:hypothetical protein [Acidimicrobiia bacterium]MYC57999.1 hypothetical protein [Acidimicrobiia bacterium]MYG94687.1 hypothetical protein [Acidimicrobiia bacterium]MYI31052.1 hypothetical protein [Acidimicrobiia bacterium]